MFLNSYFKTICSGLLSFSFAALCPHLEAASRPGYSVLEVKGPGFMTFNMNNIWVFSKKVSLAADAEGRLVSLDRGLPIQGYAIDHEGNMSSTLSDINLSNVSLIPTATTAVKIMGNLDARTEAFPRNFDYSSLAAAQATSDFNVGISIVDDLGNYHPITIFFQKFQTNSWKYFVTTTIKDLINHENATGNALLMNGNLNFTASGFLLSEEPADAILNPTPIEWVGGAKSTKPIHLLFNNDLRFTQFSTDMMVSEVSQDGSPAGSLEAYSFKENGIIEGYFSNGRSLDLYAIPLALFDSENFLYEFQAGLFVSSALSGRPQIEMSGKHGRGSFLWSFEGGQEPLENDPQP